MVKYCLKIAPHYSGLISGHFPDLPGVVVLSADHEELAILARAALEEELDRHMAASGRIPAPRARGRITILTDRFQPTDCGEEGGEAHATAQKAC